MSIDSRSALIAALARGAADDIIGTAENAWLDFKQAPYDLNKEDGKLEFAKDVTAFANAGGGVIVVGFTTEKCATTSADIAASWKHIPKSCVDFDKMRKSVESRTYPPLRTLSFRWWMEDGDSAILTIEISQATEADHPILVSKVREEDSKRELLMGLFLRAGDRVVATLPAQIHSQLQMGRQLQRFGINQLPLQHSDEQVREARRSQLEIDTKDVELLGKRRLHLQAWPATPTVLERVHGTEEDSLRRAFGEIDCIRSGVGFAFNHSSMHVGLTTGGGLRAIVHRYSLSVLRTGVTTLVASAGSDFLAHFDRTVPLAINPLALVETVLEFARFFVRHVLPRTDPQAHTWFFEGAMHNLGEGGKQTTLPPGKLRQFLPYDPPAAPDNDFDIDPIQCGIEENPGRAAYRLLVELYAHFGLSEHDIPYVTNDEIDEKKVEVGGEV